MTIDPLAETMIFRQLVPFAPLGDQGGSPTTLSYAFAGTAEPADFPLTGAFAGWTAWTATEADAARAALRDVETFANVTFEEVTGPSDLDLGKVSLPGPVAGNGGFSYATRGDDLVRYDSFAVFDIDGSALDPSILRHEIGHALGLKHPFDAPAVPEGWDSNLYTLMSYTPSPETGRDAPVFQVLDVLALQAMWGRNETHRTGDDAYRLTDTGRVDVIWDAGGRDRIEVGGDGASVDLRPGAFSRLDGDARLAVAYGAAIEDAVGGAGADRLRGSAADNALWGKRGRDVLMGAEGDDLLHGNGGRDRLRGGAGDDVLEGGRGRDRLRGGEGDDTFVLRKGMQVEVVLDWSVGDRIEARGLSSAEALSLAQQAGDDVRLELGGRDVMILRDTTVDELAFV